LFTLSGSTCFRPYVTATAVLLDTAEEQETDVSPEVLDGIHNGA